MPAPTGPVWYPGIWCDVASHPDGYAFGYTTPDNRMVVLVGDLTGPPVEVWQRALPEGVLFMRIAVDGAGEVRALATAQSDQAMYIQESGTSYLGTAVTQRATILKYESGDWVAYICRSPFTYTRWPLAGGDPGPFANPFTVSGSSQGMLDVVSGTLRWANVESGGVAGAFYTEIIQGVTVLLATTQGGVTVGAAAGPPSTPDAMLAAHDGNATVTRVIPVLSPEPYVAPFGNADVAWAMCSRTATVSGMNAALVIAPPWVGTTVASGAPSPGGGSGTPSSNTIHTVTRPRLPRSSTPKTYPHVAQITIPHAGIRADAPVAPAVREAIAASQQSTRLLWDTVGRLNKTLEATEARFTEQAEVNRRLQTQLTAVEFKAQESAAVAGKVTAQDLPPGQPGPTLPPDDGQVGGPPPPPTGGGAVVIPGTVDAITASDVTWMTTDVGNWPIGATLTNIAITASQICLDYTGKDVWPAIDPSNDGILSPGNPWVIAFIGGQYYGSTYEWLRVGQICKNVTGPEFQDYVTGTSPLDTWTPALGETVWFMVSSLARQGPQSPYNQRTQIVATVWPY